MKQLTIYSIMSLVILASCATEGLDKKKKELAELRDQARTINTRISELEKEIAQLDTSAVSAADRNAVLVNLKELKPSEFVHKINIRGSVSSRTNVLLSAETGGRITDVKVREGDKVNRGDILVTLDNDVLRNNINELKTSLELAEAVYKRQANLWEKKIGTEIQYLEAKNNVESLQSRLNTAYSQLARSIVKAPFAGTVDEVPSRVGEMAQPGMPLVRMINQGNMYIEAAVSERFISALKVGDKVNVTFPVMNKTIASEISAISEVINEENRTFNIEVTLPNLDFTTKPNQVVILDVVDYRNPSTILVPTEVILSDAQGKYLYIASSSDGNTEAKKVYIQPGRTQEGQTEVLEGLDTGAQLIVEGYRDVSEGTMIKPTDVSTETAKLN